MRVLGVVVTWLACVFFTVVAGALCIPWLEVFAENVQLMQSTSNLSPAWGIGVSVIGSAMAFLYVLITQNRPQKDTVRAYRWAEKMLIQMGKIEHKEILEYHRSYNWHAYAGLGFSTLFIIVPLFLDGKVSGRPAIEYFAIVLGLGLLAVATIILGIIDLVHTNTLTPLVTTNERFRIVHWILVLGGLALALQICAVGVFLSLISSWLSVVSTVVAVTLLVVLTELRGVPLSSLRDDRKLTDQETAVLSRHSRQ